MYQMFYINARKAGIVFTPQHELKPKEKFFALSPKVKVFPDAVFMLNYKDHNALFFFEMDERLRGVIKKNRKITRKTWGKSIEYYKTIIREKTIS